MHFARIPGIASFLFRDALFRVKEESKTAYLTFDDGPIPEVTPMVLDILAKYKVKATFFCVGDNVKKHTQIFQRIIAEGHSIGNHTFNHMDGWKANDKEYFENVNECSKVLNSKLFRPPYGRIKYSQYKELKRDYKIVMWDVLSGDYDPNISTQQCMDIVRNNVRNGSIIVFHDSLKTQHKIFKLLIGAIVFMQGNGYELKPLPG